MSKDGRKSAKEVLKIEGKINFTTETAYDWVDPKILKVDETYQRPIEPVRVDKIVRSISIHGYLVGQPITLSTSGNIVDGRHRTEAAKECNVKLIPATILKFETKMDEARYFYLINSFRPNLRPSQLWHARFKGNDPVALILYRLVSDPRSLICGKVSIRFHNSPQINFSVGDALTIILASLGYCGHWDFRKELRINEIIESSGYETILSKTNELLEFIYKVIGQEKKNNPIGWRSHTIRALCALYIQLSNSKIIQSKKEFDRLITRMSAFSFDSQFDRLPSKSKFDLLIGHINANRKNKIRIVEEMI